MLFWVMIQVVRVVTNILQKVLPLSTLKMEVICSSETTITIHKIMQFHQSLEAQSTYKSVLHDWLLLHLPSLIALIFLVGLVRYKCSISDD
jgi:hypothetical protein